MNKPYAIFLDDDRIPEDSPIPLPLLEWIIIRSYDDFTKLILAEGLPGAISFDHDMDPTAYQEYHRMWKSNKTINYDNIKEKTGYHCAKWLVEYCLSKKLPLPAYFIHSFNPVGRVNIEYVLKNYENQNVRN